MQKPNIKEILERYQSGNCTEEERIWVENWYLSWLTGEFDLSEEELMADLTSVKNKLPAIQRNTKIYYRVAAVAAAVLLILGSAFYFFKNDIGPKKDATYAKISPGSNKAVLTLSDGSQVVLDTTTNLASIDQYGVKITKDADGKLIYTSTSTGKVVDAYNMVSTPKGGQYDIVLPDGTKVKLNAASTIRFPIIFSAGERNVEFEGEGYFEVTKDSKRPFRVKSGKQTVEVLGTQFNINCYKDEPQIRTTLLEGSILLKGAEEVLLRPGEQGRTPHDAKKIHVMNVDVQTEVAWKNNLFFFENEPIINIMRQISRWYDVDVVYQNDVSDKKVWGSITRFSEISKVLEILELTGNIHFNVEGRRITVMK